MKTIAIVAVIGLAAAAFFAYSSTQNNEVEEAFRSFIEEYRVGYGNSDEYTYRLGVFEENLKRYEELNILNPEAFFGITQFSDRTSEEMKAFMGLNLPAESEYTDVYTYNSDEIVGTYDWASKMAAVKNQASCGSCWAFSAVAATEGRFHLTYKKKDRVDVTFSEQQAVDCDKSSHGCNGGWMDNAFDLFRAGIMRDSDYKYTARDGACKFDAKKAVAKVTGHTSVPRTTGALISAAQAGPVSVAVDASSWSGYRGGIMTNCGTGLNHGVTLVGSTDSQFLKIRNSWGTSWGEAGHIRIAKESTCGANAAASYPTVVDM